MLKRLLCALIGHKRMGTPKCWRCRKVLWPEIQALLDNVEAQNYAQTMEAGDPDGEYRNG